MRKKSILKHQVVKKKNRKILSTIWKIFSLISFSFIKLSCLLVGLIIISLLFLYAYQYMLSTPYIRLERVIITGVHEKMKRELLQRSGLSSDVSLLAINLNDLRKELEEHPWIRSVQLEKRFPHTLIIRVEKEEPWAVVAMGQLYYMDRWGEIFKRVDPVEDLDYPVITGVSEGIRNRLEQLKLATNVLGVLESEKDVWSWKDISEIHVKESGNVCLYFGSIPAVVKFRGRELPTKIDELKKVLGHLRRTGRIHIVRGINLHYRDGAVVSFKPS